MNGFVFRLEQSDFPLYASDWDINRSAFDWPDDHDLQACCIMHSLEELAARYGKEFFTAIENQSGYSDFEIIIPHHIDAKRISRIIRERSDRGQPEQLD